jgi:hypothetical protein
VTYAMAVILMIVWLGILLIAIIALVDSLRRDSASSRGLSKELRQLTTPSGRRTWLARIRGALTNDDRP